MLQNKVIHELLLTHAQIEAKRSLHESKNIMTNICSILSKILSPEENEKII